MGDLTKYDFHGDRLDIVERDGQVYVAPRSVCDALDLDHSTQLRKLRGKAWATVVMMTAVGQDGRTRQMAGLRLDSLPMWLATIDAEKVKSGARSKLVRFQLECHDALRDHFMPRSPRAETFAPATAPIQSRISDDPRAKSTLQAWFQTARTITGRTIQSLQGELRQPWGVASVYRVPLVALEHTVAAIQQIIVEATRRQRLPPDRRQQAMPWREN